MKVAFRVDGNSHIGMGHIMRCLSLADALADSGADVLFLVSDSSAVDVIAKRGYRCQSLNSKWNDYLYNIDHLCALLQCSLIDWVITDSYYASAEYYRVISALCKTAMISEDDPDDAPVTVDLFINYNLYMKSCNVAHARCTFCLGPQYAILRKEFSNVQSTKGEAILILTGGSDPLNIAPAFAERLISSIGRKRKIIIVSGSVNPNLKQLERFCNLEGISLRIDVHNMAQVMLESAVAISAGGSTLYELCACGIPTVTYAFTSNQIRNVIAFEKEGLMPYAGFYPNDEKNVIDNVAFFTKKLLENQNQRRVMTQKLKEICDGTGAKKIVKTILTVD